MSRSVATALFQAVEDGGVDPDYGTLPDRYRETARRLVRAYATDAAFNGLSYDRGDELSQVRTYAEAVGPPGPDERLPAWRDAPLDPAAVREAAAADVTGAGGEPR
jgi:glucosyl-3-phosphoglycerate synthase